MTNTKNTKENLVKDLAKHDEIVIDEFKKPKTIKISDLELAQLTEYISEERELLVKFSELHRDKLLLKNTELNLESNYFDLLNRKRVFSQKINDRYGSNIHNINEQTGEITFLGVQN